MAKYAVNSNKVSGKIRFIMLEADLEDGNLAEIAQAISNAVRPSIVQQIMPQTQVPKVIAGAKVTSPNTTDGVGNEIDDEDNLVANNSTETSTPKKRTPRERSVFKGEILDNIDWDGGTSPFVEYMRAANPQDTTKKYLLIAAWFKRHAGQESDHCQFNLQRLSQNGVASPGRSKSTSSRWLQERARLLSFRNTWSLCDNWHRPRPRGQSW